MQAASLNFYLHLREVKSSALEIWFGKLSNDQQFAVAFASLAVPCLIIGLASWFISTYPEPIGFWAFIGRYIRPIITVSLILIFLYADFRLAYKFAKRPFLQMLLILLMSFSLVLIPSFWWYVSRPPQLFTGQAQEYIDYLNFLRSRLSTFIPIWLGVLPWLALILKSLGLDFFASAVGLLKGKDKGK